MFIDALLQFSSSAQALSGAGTVASTDTIDLGQERRLGSGEQMGVVICVTAAMTGTSPTFQCNIQSDDNSGFSSAANVASSATFSTLAVGSRVIIPIPPGVLTERYLRLSYTLGGTTPAVSVKSFVQPLNQIESQASYASGFVIS